eukprot:CAMPEP_0203827414 /NCGR_PEP_ID=MMETSP0115-20131106/58927_1 /ASSEMBLY_ACC=CAM_ASM_000227 /TAXON_ID=33651 /ORGANISM="Bicosoecid sp, Strain ms1" /LENGTH=203 /DNA_ID=CAMNT_0050736473 /DNA_START=30 /DNA_END=638 /DNA_ORIENTATION=+
MADAGGVDHGRDAKVAESVVAPAGGGDDGAAAGGAGNADDAIEGVDGFKDADDADPGKDGRVGVPIRRAVFISASALASNWRSVPRATMHKALFFFGSKRRWLFPADEEERKEARAQPGRYHLMDKGFLALVAQKDARGEVHFLKRDDLAYERYPGPEDAAAYARASAWLQGLGYAPLRLDDEWWAAHGKGARHAAAVVRNYR